ncbi:MAG TPA: hypothetical protein VNX68_08255, partial [Nitrosopumilaceae archaeon]|jgi:hypothetical protein|nr:hypothetical protein [Nitrosopumilaceae archaeon]
MKKIIALSLSVICVGFTTTKAQTSTWNTLSDGTINLVPSTGPVGFNVGPKTGWLHMIADPTNANTGINFYFNRDIYTSSGVFGSYNAPLTFKTTSFVGSTFTYATRMTISNGNGYVGINQTNPSAMLDVAASNVLNERVFNGSSVYNGVGRNIFMVTGLTSGAYNNLSQNGDMGLFWADGTWGASGSSFVIAPWKGTADGIRIQPNGNVSIGTATPNTCKLAVEGKIGCREIDVLVGPFPDYVFKKDYAFLSLKDLEKYIDANKHLPNMPSAVEVSENGNKISLGEMQIKQIEKIEELTLYIIELNKKIEMLEKKSENK